MPNKLVRVAKPVPVVVKSEDDLLLELADLRAKFEHNEAVHKLACEKMELRLSELEEEERSERAKLQRRRDVEQRFS